MKGGLRIKWLAAAWLACGMGAVKGGSITLDGSLGHAAGAVNSVNGLYKLTPAGGEQVGGNLFFSLGNFNLDKGETAQFSGPASITNILTRVTGGESNIDGTIQSTIAGANFYLINPAGVVFGPDAAINVKGSFAVSTADEIKLADGAIFSVAGTSDASLTTAAPAAFGFLSASPAAVTINGTLAVAAGQSIAVAGGGVEVAGGALQASGGQIAIASVGSSGTAILTGQSANPVDVSSFDSLGNIQLNNAQINASGATGGRIVIRGGQLVSSASTISSVTQSAGTGGGIDIKTTGDLSLSGGEINGNAAGSGAAGNVTIRAQTLEVLDGAIIADASSGLGAGGNVSVAVSGLATLDGSGAPGQTTGIIAQTHDTAPGAPNAGNLSVSAGEIRILGDATINSGTTGAGSGGNLSVASSGDLRIDNQGAPDSTGIFADSSLTTAGAGNAGSIDVAAASLHMAGGGNIAATTFGPGAGGNVSVFVSGLARLNGAGDMSATTEIRSQTNQTAAGGGDGGNVMLKAASLQVLDGAQISSTTFGSGDGGDVAVSVSGPAVFQGSGNSAIFTGLAAQTKDTGGGGNAGRVMLSAASLQISNGAQIASSTFGAGNGGNVAVKVAGDAMLMGTGSSSPITGVVTEAFGETSGAGSGGNASLSAASLEVMSGAQINADTIGPGAGGNVAVNVSGSIMLQGVGAGVPTGFFAQTLQTAPGGGAGGNISVNAGNIQILDGGGISASTFGTANCGNVSIVVANVLTLNGADANDGTGIYSDTKLANAGGNGGVVSVRGASVRVLDGAEIASDTFGSGKGGDINVGVSGNIRLDARGGSVATGIFVNSNSSSSGSGNSGTIALSAGSMDVLAGAEIGAVTFGTGNSEQLSVIVNGPLTLDGTGSSGLFNGIATQSQGKQPGAGSAGNLDVSAKQILIRDRSAISASSLGSGDGGNITLSSPGAMTINGGGMTGNTGVFANSRSPTAGSGNGGVIAVNTGVLTLMNDGEIGAGTYGTGNGGAVHVSVAGLLTLDGTAEPGAFTGIANLTHFAGGGGGKAGDIDVNAGGLIAMNGGAISATSAGSGAAGNIAVDTAGDLQLESSGGIFVSAPQSRGGRIKLIAGGNVLLQNGTISARAVQLGNIFIFTAPDSVVLVLGSTITAEAQTVGGQITIDPAVVVIGDGSVINGLAGDQNLTVQIAAGALIVSPDSRILADRASFTVDTDVTGALLALPPSSFGGEISLVPGCVQMIGGDVSSFVQSGVGGLAPGPGGFFPAYGPALDSP